MEHNDDKNEDFVDLLAGNLKLVIKMLLLMAPIPLVFLAVYLGVLYIKPYTPHWLNTTFSVLVAITLCHRLLHRIGELFYEYIAPWRSDGKEEK